MLDTVGEQLTAQHDDSSEAGGGLDSPLEEHPNLAWVNLVCHSTADSEIVRTFAARRPRRAEHRLFVDDNVARSRGILKTHLHDSGLWVVVDPAIGVHLKFGHQTQSPIDVKRPKIALLVIHPFVPPRLLPMRKRGP